MYFTLFLVWVGAPIEPLTRLIETGGKFMESLSHWNGLFTFLAALYAGSKAVQVSQHRREEAEAAEFRDYMKWIAENIDLDGTQPEVIMKSNFGLNILYKYIKEPPASLSEMDLAIARNIRAEILEGSDPVSAMSPIEKEQQFSEQGDADDHALKDEIFGRPQHDSH
ncbi:hypothetical protein VVR12_03135 [Rothia sp. LK2588]|uniref:hypothetical protein n=1 Tax=Rothia sp. LK2588 TaxID=3114369 RepID=UPI0034CD9C68